MRRCWWIRAALPNCATPWHACCSRPISEPSWAPAAAAALASFDGRPAPPGHYVFSRIWLTEVNKLACSHAYFRMCAPVGYDAAVMIWGYLGIALFLLIFLMIGSASR